MSFPRQNRPLLSFQPIKARCFPLKIIIAATHSVLQMKKGDGVFERYRIYKYQVFMPTSDICGRFPAARFSHDGDKKNIILLLSNEQISFILTGSAEI